MKPYYFPFAALVPYLGKIRKMFALATAMIVVGGLYIAILEMEWEIAYIGLYILTGILFCAVFFLNGGFAKELPTPDKLRDDWSDAQKADYIEKLKKRRAIAKKLMYLLVPMLLVVFIDILWVFLGQMFQK